MTEVFVEQPLALSGSANDLKLIQRMRSNYHSECGSNEPVKLMNMKL